MLFQHVSIESVAHIDAPVRLSSAEIESGTVRGRYGPGRVAGRRVTPYAEEQGVDTARETETFAWITLWVDNWRWAGVPFILCTGKALGSPRREIRLGFKRVPHLAFGQVSSRPPTS